MMAHQGSSDIRPLVIRNRVEHVDTDASGVMHFSRYASLSETAALEKLEELGAGLEVFQEFGLDLRVHELRIKYFAPAYFRDDILLEGAIAHLGPARIRLTVRILRESGETEPLLLAISNLELAVVDRQRVQPVPIPDTLRSLLGENQK
jgi:acyl-CoA thioester hydrolase